MDDSSLYETQVLVEEAKAGKAAALNQLLEDHIPWVRNVVRINLGAEFRNLTVDEDILQTTLIKAFKNIDKFEYQSKGSFKSWIAKIATNAMKDYLRRSSRIERPLGQRNTDSWSFGQLEEQKGVRPSQFLEGMDEGVHLVNRVIDALIEMEEKKRRAYICRNELEMSYEEICKEFGFSSLGSARKLVAEARKELHRRLEQR